MKEYKQIVIKPTHRYGGIIDHIYVNKHNMQYVLEQFPVYFSDHQLLLCALTYKEFFK